ncbi:hypothetical protein ACFL47_07115 [Candidatus Latescibacterota bacterium]
MDPQRKRNVFNRIFPKLDEITSKTNSGNFINATLFGKIVKEKTVFLNPEDIKPYTIQYEVLKNIKKNTTKTIRRSYRNGNRI